VGAQKKKGEDCNSKFRAAGKVPSQKLVGGSKGGGGGGKRVRGGGEWIFCGKSRKRAMAKTAQPNSKNVGIFLVVSGCVGCFDAANGESGLT